MIVLPGDTPADTISAIIADEAAIGMVNSKTTAVRVIPAIGHEAGEDPGFWRASGNWSDHEDQPQVLICYDPERRQDPGPYAESEKLD